MKQETVSVLRDFWPSRHNEETSSDPAFGRALASLWIAYQPIVRCCDRRVIAHEALVRSDEPSLGDPLALLRAASRRGKRGRVGRRLRQLIAHDLMAFQEDVFVNLDPEDLLDAELVDGTGPLAAFASRIVLEITERAPLERVPNLSGRLARLRDQGFRVAVDDLGAGYSGNVNLAILEPDVVKLDMSLVRGVDRDPTRRDVVRSVVRLCQKLRALVVAEGVERESERDVLVELGCDALQGFLFARPSRTLQTITW